MTVLKFFYLDFMCQVILKYIEIVEVIVIVLLWMYLYDGNLKRGNLKIIIIMLFDYLVL